MAWPKTLQVDRNIVNLLSRSTYDEFPRALREMVSNAYDADATRVEITIDASARTMVVEDNGWGMTVDEFDFYLRIGGRSASRRTSRLGRERVGQFGIGFLALFPFCERMQVESKIAGQATAFRAVIPTAQLTRDSGVPEDVGIAPVDGVEFTVPGEEARHYTRFTLSGLNFLVDRYLAEQADIGHSSLSIRSWTAMDRFRWELEESLPVPFERTSEVAAKLGPPSPSLSVVVNRRPLRRHDYTEDVLDAASEITIDGVTLRYAIGTPWRAVHPYEARGLKLRLRGVGVGERTNLDLQIHGRTFSRLHWLSGDVEIVHGLDATIALNRDAFTTTLAWESVREFLRERLRKCAGQVEDVDVARRRINKAIKLTESIGAAAGPLALSEVRRHAATLQSKGFVVREREAGPGHSPVEVNVIGRTVDIAPEHKAFSQTALTPLPVAPTEWDAQLVRSSPARVTPDGTIEYDPDYPPFATDAGPVLRRVHKCLALALTQSDGTIISLINWFNNYLLDEFRE